jgi:hypothetical protein
MNFYDIAGYLPIIIIGAVAIGLGSVWGWVHTTKLKINAGYPLEGMWGQSLHPKRDAQADHRITLLTQENAALQAEIGSLKDRLASVERIVTDSSYQLTHDIERLRDAKTDGSKVQ